MLLFTLNLVILRSFANLKYKFALKKSVVIKFLDSIDWRSFTFHCNQYSLIPAMEFDYLYIFILEKVVIVKVAL